MELLQANTIMDVYWREYITQRLQWKNGHKTIIERKVCHLLNPLDNERVSTAGPDRVTVWYHTLGQNSEDADRHPGQYTNKQIHKTVPDKWALSSGIYTWYLVAVRATSTKLELRNYRTSKWKDNPRLTSEIDVRDWRVHYENIDSGGPSEDQKKARTGLTKNNGRRFKTIWS